MPTGSESIQGPRLEFVARKLPGVVTRMKYDPPPPEARDNEGKRVKVISVNKQIEVVEDAGYMIFFPTGNAYRLTGAELVKRKFDRQPSIISFEQANNTDTPAGRFKLARHDREREKAWKEMEEQVIKMCVGRFGTLDALIANYDPKGKLPVHEKEAA